MASENNRWIGEGCLGKDPQYRTGQNKNGGTWEMCKISIACEREDEDKVKDKDGNERFKTDWIDIVSWGDVANEASYLHKGDVVHVEGRLEHNNWTGSDGVKHYDMQVEADIIQQQDKASRGSETAHGTSYNPKKDYNEEEVKKQVAEENDIDPDDLPF